MVSSYLLVRRTEDHSHFWVWCETWTSWKTCAVRMLSLCCRRLQITVNSDKVTDRKLLKGPKPWQKDQLAEVECWSSTALLIMNYEEKHKPSGVLHNYSCSFPLFTLWQTKQHTELLNWLGLYNTLNVSEHANREGEVTLSISTPYPHSSKTTSERAAFSWVIWDHLGNTCTQLGLQTQTHTAVVRERKILWGHFLSSVCACVTAWMRSMNTAFIISADQSELIRQQRAEPGLESPSPSPESLHSS